MLYSYHTTAKRKVETAPRKRVHTNDALLATYVKEILSHTKYEMPYGWCVYAVNSRRGKCSYHNKYISIPQWAINKDEAYLTWYVAHEMAHMITWAYKHVADNHGPVFMSVLKEICPIESQQYEYTYKPRNAASAGLAMK